MLSFGFIKNRFLKKKKRKRQNVSPQWPLLVHAVYDNFSKFSRVLKMYSESTLKNKDNL